MSGGGEISSVEGTTQGDPLSMVFFVLATLTFERRYSDFNFGNDSAGCPHVSTADLVCR